MIDKDIAMWWEDFGVSMLKIEHAWRIKSSLGLEYHFFNLSGFWNWGLSL